MSSIANDPLLLNTTGAALLLGLQPRLVRSYARAASGSLAEEGYEGGWPRRLGHRDWFAPPGVWRRLLAHALARRSSQAVVDSLLK